MSVQLLVEKSCKVTGEGPHWDEQKQVLYYVDIESGDIHVYDPAINKDAVVHIDGNDFLTFVIPRHGGGFVVGRDRQLCTYDMESGQVSVIKEVEQGQHSRFNDAKCDASGRLWAGTMGISCETKKEDEYIGALYSADADGTVTPRDKPFDISNGLAWSLDNKTFYFVDSSPRKIYAYDYDMSSGEISNKRTLVDFADLGSKAELGFPDGMCIDTDGNLWVACFGSGKVIQFDSKTGRRMRDVDIEGAKQITSVCFGGTNLDQLYITSANHPQKCPDDPQMKKQPLAGSLFRVIGLGVKGLPAPRFEG